MSDRLSAARAALESLPPDELRARKQRAAYASRAARRQMRDEAITVTIRPAHMLTPAQLAAWRELWRVLLAPEPESERGGEGRGDA
ncbi:hypothetical protein [Sphaerobacter thermophilus]|uniref:Uncharacterized protein n=1 Tax=Sphaerobacter thermophilus (strain ATCC 49802 / DSM 20745 / KCCM 41009 / NCIMB 13125 / S 6022) TaxID=479434 RepID=D1C3U3_SPHTD|nr:hypothetical protein [Sphaerobacter thermophilus]ACZ38910.1 hypothetical protein Sthe_1475 [Sphaerobacter thermophilus DSM 20745]